MILYNVTVKVDASAAEEWVKWMKEEHIPELMHTGLFTDARLMRLMEVDDSEGPTYAAQYYCTSKAEYQRYIDEHAAAMRAKGIERFGDKFIAFRSVMELV